jgi:hypothetical protein
MHPSHRVDDELSGQQSRNLAQAEDARRHGACRCRSAQEPSAADYLAASSNVNVLIPNDEVFDRFTGQPRMSNVPVRIEPVLETAIGSSS